MASESSTYVQHNHGGANESECVACLGEEHTLCDITVRKAGEPSGACGLELPCPVHEYDVTATRAPGETAGQFTKRYFGESRDV